MKINPFLYGIAVIIIFFGVILGFQAAGIWSTSGKVNSSGNRVEPVATDPTTIKGWMTLEQICSTYNVSLDGLLAQFNLPADTPAATSIKDLESDTFETSTLIDWLQSRLDAATLPPPAPERIVPTIAANPETPTPEPTEHAAPEYTITGQTSFQNLLDWGVSEDTIRQIIGGDLPEPSTLIKDYAISQGLQFSTLKTLCQDAVDQLKP